MAELRSLPAKSRDEFAQKAELAARKFEVAEQQSLFDACCSGESADAVASRKKREAEFRKLCLGLVHHMQLEREAEKRGLTLQPM